MDTTIFVRLAGAGSRAFAYTPLRYPAALWCVQNYCKTKWARMKVERLSHAVKLSSLRPISSSGTSTFDPAESYGFSDRLPVVTVRPHAPVLPSSPPLTLSPRIREPAPDMHLRSPGTDRCAYRCPLAGARCPDTSSSRAAPSWRVSLRPGAHRLRFAPPFTVPPLSPLSLILTINLTLHWWETTQLAGLVGGSKPSWVTQAVRSIVVVKGALLASTASNPVPLPRACPSSERACLKPLHPHCVGCCGSQ